MTSQEKTEAPTPQRRQKAREQGQTAKSPEVNAVIALMGGVLTLKFLGGDSYGEMQMLMRRSFENLATKELTQAAAFQHSMALGATFIKLMAPLFAILIVLALLSNLAQSRLLFSLKALAPDFSRIDPLKGFKRLFSGRALFDLFKSLAKVGIVGWVAYGVFQGRYAELVTVLAEDVLLGAQMLTNVLFELALKAGAALLILAVADYGYQRWAFEKSIRMSKDELKEETRHTEGSPETRTRVRRQQRKMSAQRMMQSVPRATVVITNPTQLAIALEYDPERMDAPRVVAKGADLIAARIREIAKEHKVPLIDNKPLAWALYRSTEIGDTIPAALYQTVAEVLAFVFRLEREAQGRYRGGVAA